MSNELDTAINQEIDRLVQKGVAISPSDVATNLSQYHHQPDMQKIAERADELLRIRFDPVKRAEELTAMADAIMDGTITASHEEVQALVRDMQELGMGLK